MKTDISSLELNFILKEMQHLVGAKVEQVYQIGKDELILQLHVPSVGKRIVRAVLGKAMYIASVKGDVPETPPGFCLYLRKRLKNARLKELHQLGFERIVEMSFETKDAVFRLVIELFSKGNIVLCEKDGVILSAMERQEWKDRSVKSKEMYKYPEKEFNFLLIAEADLTNLFHKSDKENVVKALAIELGLGGTYAEELCLMAKIDKNLKPAQLSDKELSALHKSIVELRDKDISPVIYKSAEGQIKDVVPFELGFYKTLQSEKAEDFNSALDSVLTAKVETKAVETAEKAATTKISKVEEVISQQRQRIDGLEKSQEENQRKGELIYENYPLVQTVLDEIREMRKKSSWKQVKEQFKGHKIIRSVDDKTGEITLEL